MGETTFVKQPAADNRAKPASLPRSLNLRFDVPLLLSVISLLVFGLLMVYSASWKHDMVLLNQQAGYMLGRQFIFVIGGSVLAVAIAMIDYRRYPLRLVIAGMLGTLLLLLIVLIVKDTRLGADRSIFEGSVRPSELAKLVVIVYLAYWLYSKRDQLNELSFGLFPMLGIVGITSGLILGQPDLSAAATVIVLGALMFYLSGGSWRQITVTMIITTALGLLVANASATGRARLSQYIGGLTDPAAASYHVQRSVEAIVNGGLLGMGIGRGATKFTGIPVAPTDSIFAIIVEEIGLLGAGAIICLYLVILWRGLSIARRAPDMLGQLLASGLTLWVILEAIINMGVLVNLLPFAGNALPLISAGGSSMVVTLAALGVIMSVARVSKTEQSSLEGRFFGAVVDLRRRDRRRRVPRPVDPAGPRQ